MTHESIKKSRGYWMLVSQDLSLRSKAKRKQAQEFKRILAADGFDAIQPSLYARFCASAEVCETHQSRICKIAPKFSKLTFVRLTDLQFQGVFRKGKHALTPFANKPKVDYNRLDGCHKTCFVTVLQSMMNATRNRLMQRQI